MSSPASLASNFSRYVGKLYDIQLTEGISRAQTLEQILALGCDVFGIDTGYVNRIDTHTQTQEVISAHTAGGETRCAGEVYDHENTFCQQTVAQKTPLAVAHASADGSAGDEVNKKEGTECYLGASISVGGTLYGTVCFVSQEPRADSFRAEEKGFVDLVARAVAREIQETITHDESRIKNRAVENASVAISIIETDVESSRFVYHNEQFEQLTGYSRETVRGETLVALCGPETSAETVDRFGHRLENGHAHEAEICLYRKDGTQIWVRLSAVPVSDDHGEQTHHVLFYQEITARRQDERLLAVLNRILRHNLRNRVTVAEGFLHKLTEGTEMAGSPELSKITTALDDLSELSHAAKTLEQCRQETENLRELDIVPIVSEVVRSLEAETTGGRIGLSTPETQTVIATDHIQTALAELGDNALKHGGEDPEVEFRVDPLPDEQYVRVAVSDDGPGLPEPDRLTLEGRPETPMEHGSGLGLFLVYWIVSSHGGHVAVSVDGGTTVELFLPTKASLTQYSKQ